MNPTPRRSLAPRTRVEEIESLIKKHHPNAEYGSTEPEIPAFP